MISENKKQTALSPFVEAFHFYLKTGEFSADQAEKLALLMLEIAQLHQLKEMKKVPNVAALVDVKMKKAVKLQKQLKMFETSFNEQDMISSLESELNLSF